jgi:hypothetical protein
LYVSSWDGGRKVFVYDIKKESEVYIATLIQVINPSSLSKDIIGYGNLNWVIDVDKSMLYSVAYGLPDSSLKVDGNFICVTWYELPKIDSNKMELILSDSDMKGNMKFPVINAFQDMFINDGKLYIASGYPSTDNFFENKIYAIDLLDHSFSSQPLLLSGEPEGFCSYNGSNYIYMAEGLFGNVFTLKL